MIPIKYQAEPCDFDENVRQKGLNDFKNTGKVNSKYWKGIAKKDLYPLYDGICAYYSFYIDLALADATVDHFLPKEFYPNLAYEWDNYRLSSIKANRNKGTNMGILDPFTIEKDTFFINFVDGSVYVNPKILPKIVQQAEYTIDVLKLNDILLRERRRKALSDYWNNQISEDKVKSTAPFVWYEAVRQKLI